MPPTVKVVRRPEGVRTSYLRATLKGMALTFKHLINPDKVTVQYPEEKFDVTAAAPMAMAAMPAAAAGGAAEEEKDDE